jgi:hypothetical protein
MLEMEMVSDTLSEQRFPVFSLQSYRTWAEESFDLAYLNPTTCEAVLGLMFAGISPLVRSYIGKGSSSTNPINKSFSSAATYVSEGVRETMMDMPAYHTSIPSLTARNAYDDQQDTPATRLRSAPVEMAPQPIPPPDGYMGVCNYILKREQGAPTKVPEDLYRHQELAGARKAAQQEAEAKDLEIRCLKPRLRTQRERTRRLESQRQARQDP